MLIFDPSVNGPGTPFSIIEAGSLPNGLFAWGVFNITNTQVPALYTNGVMYRPPQYRTQVSQASYAENSLNPANDPRATIPPGGITDPQYTGTEVAGLLNQFGYESAPGFGRGSIGGEFGSPMGVYSQPGLSVQARSQVLAVSHSFGRDWLIQGVFPYNQMGWDGESIYLAIANQTSLQILQTTPFSLGWTLVGSIPLSSAPSAFQFIPVVGAGTAFAITQYNTSHVATSISIYYLNGTTPMAPYNTAAIASLNVSDYDIAAAPFNGGTALFLYALPAYTLSKAFLFEQGGFADVTSVASSYLYYPTVPLRIGYQLPQKIRTWAQLYPTAVSLSSSVVSPI